MHSLSDESELWKRACNSIKSTFGRVFLYFFHLHKLFLLLHSNASIFLSMPQNSLYLLFSCTRILYEYKSIYWLLGNTKKKLFLFWVYLWLCFKQIRWFLFSVIWPIWDVLSWIPHFFCNWLMLLIDFIAWF